MQKFDSNGWSSYSADLKETLTVAVVAAGYRAT